MFCVRIVEWLWADYMLYDYFKSRFKSKLEAFGQRRLELEKEILRNISDNTLLRCKQVPLEKYCEYFNKGELKFLDELRETQRNRSLQLLESAAYKMLQNKNLTK